MLSEDFGLAALAYCLHVTLQAKLRQLAGGLTPRTLLEKFASMQMMDVFFPTEQPGKELLFQRYTQVEDTSARTFITQFYKAHLDRGIANAVRAASIRTISIGGKLHQWAGFVNVGHGRSIALAL